MRRVTRMVDHGMNRYSTLRSEANRRKAFPSTRRDASRKKALANSPLSAARHPAPGHKMPPTNFYAPKQSLYAMDDPTRSMTTRDREDDPCDHVIAPKVGARGAQEARSPATRRTIGGHGRRALGSDAESTSNNGRIVTTKIMRALSGKHTAAALRKWASGQGIPTLQGANGPFTTMDALNHALGLGPTSDHRYSAEDVA